MSSAQTVWDGPAWFRSLSELRSTDPVDNSTFHQNSLTLSLPTGSSTSPTDPPSSTLSLAPTVNRSPIHHSLATWLELPSGEISGTGGCTISSGASGSTFNDEEINSIHAPTNNTKPVKKRKAADMEILAGKQLTDTYSKRSSTLIEKAIELEKLTGAYIVVYTARPESIGNGNYRLHMSNNLRDGNCNLTRGLSGAVDTIQAVSEAAHTSGQDGRHRKRRRIDTSREQSASLDYAVGLPTQRTSNTSVTSINLSPQMIDGASASGNDRPSIDHSDETSTRPLTTSTTVAVPASSSANHTTTDTSTICVSFEKSEVSSLVHLLTSGSRDIQLYGLAIVRKLVDSGYITQVHDANVIAPLVELLKGTPASENDVTSQSVIILSQIAQHQDPCWTMIAAGIIPLLSHLLSLPISGTMLAVVAGIMSQCAVHQRYYRHFGILFPRNVLQPLINLLDFGETDVYIAAAEAISNIASSNCAEVLQHLLDEHVVTPLCRLFSKCTDLLALEKVASAIGRIIPDEDEEELHIEDNKDINLYVLRPLVDLLGHRKDEVRTEALRALYRIAHSDNLINSFAETIVLPHVIPLISTSNDRLFMEALLCACRWTSMKNWNRDRPEYINISVLTRLMRLLSCHEEEFAASAARTISKMVHFSDQFCTKVVDQKGVPLLIGLLSSKNMEVVRAAAKALRQTFFWDRPYFLCGDVVSALVKALPFAFDSQRALKAVIQAIVYLWERANEYLVGPKVEEELILAGVIPSFVRFLSLGEDFKLIPGDDFICCVSVLIESSRIARITFLDLGGARSLIRFLSTMPPRYQYTGIDTISLLAHRSLKSRKELQQAGADSFLSGYLANSYYFRTFDAQSSRETAKKVLELLRSESVGKSGQWPVG